MLYQYYYQRESDSHYTIRQTGGANSEILGTAPNRTSAMRKVDKLNRDAVMRANSPTTKQEKVKTPC